MKRRLSLAPTFVLLLALVTLAGCDGEDPGDNTNASVNTNAANTNINVNLNSNVGNANGSGNRNNNANSTRESTPPSIDEIKARMGVGDVAFNVPETVKLDAAETVELVLSPKQTGEELKEEVRSRGRAGRIESHRIKISKRMQAVLTGDGFKVTHITTPDTLPVSEDEPTRWLWDVRPERVGKVTLHLVVNAIVDFEDGAGQQPYTIKTFDKSYEVEVPRNEAAAGDPRPANSGGVWPWLLPALLVPAGGAAAWLWLRGRKRPRRGPASRLFQTGGGDSKIFLSYRREDSAGHVGRLRDSLAAHFGPERVFMDLESIGYGEDFVETVEKAVASSAVVVVVIGRQWLSVTDKKGGRRLDDPGDFVHLEVSTALKRGVKIIPALVQDAEMPGTDSLPEPLAKLARRNAIEVSDSRWAFDVERLIAAIEEALSQEPSKQTEQSTLPG